MQSVQRPTAPRGVRTTPFVLSTTGRGKALMAALECAGTRIKCPGPGRVLASVEDGIVLQTSPTENKPGIMMRRLSIERRLSGGSDYSDERTPDDCEHCNRRSRNIVCRACGHTFNGRIRMECPDHPHVIHLMDVDCCPNCKASHLKEFGMVTIQSRTN